MPPDLLAQLRPYIHYGLHFGLPLVAAILITQRTKHSWWKIYIVMLLAMLIDLDHLLATPVFDPNRCSIGFHPLHSVYAIIAYTLLLIPLRTRIVAIGLLLHILTDVVDCGLI